MLKSSDNTNPKMMSVQAVQERIGAIRSHVKQFDHEAAFSEEIALMKDYIRLRAWAGDKRAAEIMTSWDIKFNRYCA